jgi:aminoglycoside 6-adenylyltransferase
MTHKNHVDISHITSGFRAFIETSLTWASEADDVLMAVVLGSQANPDHPTDEWSDIDLALIVQDMTPYDLKGQWIRRLTPFEFIYAESAEIGTGITWHVILKNHLMIDLSVFSIKDVQGWMRESDSVKSESEIFFKSELLILIDKIDLFTRLVGEDGMGDLLRQGNVIPSAEAIESVIHEFWYHTLRAIKHLNRDDLWRAFMSCNHEIKRPLLQMIEWQTKASKGWNVDTLYEGRMIAKWANDDVVSQFPVAFQGYDRAALARGLIASIDLFETLSQEVTDALDQPVDISRYQKVSQRSRQFLNDLL